MNITISNNIIEGRKPGKVRIRLHEIDQGNGNKQPTNTVFDLEPGQEERVNLLTPFSGFEARPIIEGKEYSSDTQVTPDIFSVIDAYKALKIAVLAVPAIRNDETIPQGERDVKAAAAWASALRLAKL